MAGCMWIRASYDITLWWKECAPFHVTGGGNSLKRFVQHVVEVVKWFV